MKTTSVLLLASAALASAQVKYEDGKYVCEQENASYCAGDSLGTDIIIRCNGKVGQPGRCSDNLAGQPPLGNHPALCYQTSPTAGDAACEKNCVVYPAAGNPFTLPADICTPTGTGAEPTTTITFIDPAPSSSTASGEPTTTITFIHPAPSSSSGEPTTTLTSIHPAPSSSGGGGKPSTVTTALVNPSQSHAGSSSSPTRGANGTQTTGGVKPPVHTGGAATAAKGVAGAVAVVLGGAVAVLL
ncbi:hypothetical protein C8A01DRAFT_38044 [Parachaetomium inaequale]|uniref:Uncharacterized protein n=1 Tax=Parachaetomium inaequale TaxID=2588326 RepID=A0AAN6SQ67_9PEZI|nr:hypothetical protein C8A01DRAFT_38044 [Parachaetomium inaequale]